MAKFNFEDYRQPWETGPHWELKREFIEKYSDTFDQDRLLCLAQAYSNVVLMNCSYPDPVMQQISILSKPLEMRKRFQEGNNTSEPKNTPKCQPDRVSEKMKSIYGSSGRPFKQVKFCSSTEQSSPSSDSTIPHESVSKQSDSALNTNNHQISQQTSDSISTAVSSQDQPNSTVSNSEIKETVLKNEEKIILSTLGLDLIQNLVQLIRSFQMKFSSPFESLMNAVQKMKILGKINFDISLDPESSPRAKVFISKFSVDNCEISVGTGPNKKSAKLKSAEIGIDILTKLSSACISPVSNLDSHTVTGSDSFISNKTPENEKELKSAVERLKDTMSVLQAISEKIVNRTKAQSSVIALKNIAKMIPQCIAFDTVSDSQNSEYISKLFIKNTLIASGKAATINQAKELAVESGFAKLEKLSNYEIRDDKLVEKQSSTSFDADTSDFKMEQTVSVIKKSEKLPFVLNRQLFNSSLRDGFVLLDNLALKPITQRNLKTMVQESSGFCHKPFEYRLEDVVDSNVTLKKADIVIADNIVGTGVASTKEAAKILACEHAVEMLRKKYYTLKVNNEYIDGYIITRNQVFEGESFASGALTESNVGCKMLKSMGWTGGGLRPTGISEPIEAQGHHQFGRGLGFGDGKNDIQVFKKKIQSMLQDYSKTNTLSGLVFSKEFSKDERKEIHKIALRFNLHTASKGTNENRFLTVRHKYNVSHVLRYLANNGGYSSKYELIDASEKPFEL